MGANNEIFKGIPGYEGLYQISNLGRVKSLARFKKHSTGSLAKVRERILKIHINKRYGYVYVLLKNKEERKGHRVHRLVAKAFIDNPKNKLEVNHLNEIKHDNNVSNLEWVTRKENINHGTGNLRRSLTSRNIGNSIKAKPVNQYDLNGVFLNTWPSTKEADRNGYSSSCISNCCRGLRKTHKKNIWSYV